MVCDVPDRDRFRWPSLSFGGVMDRPPVRERRLRFPLKIRSSTVLPGLAKNHTTGSDRINGARRPRLAQNGLTSGGGMSCPVPGAGSLASMGAWASSPGQGQSLAAYIQYATYVRRQEQGRSHSKLSHKPQMSLGQKLAKSPRQPHGTQKVLGTGGGSSVARVVWPQLFPSSNQGRGANLL